MKSEDMGGIVEYEDDTLTGIWDNIKKRGKGKKFSDVLNEILSADYSPTQKELTLNNILGLCSRLKNKNLQSVYYALIKNAEGISLIELSEKLKTDTSLLKKDLGRLIEMGHITKAKRRGTFEDVYSLNVWRHKYFDYPEKITTGPRIPLMYHMNMLDDPRLPFYEKAILNTVKRGDVVADLGTGTGIFALIASKKAKRVYAIDIDPYLVEYAKSIVQNYGLEDTIIVEHGDALAYDLPEKVDVIICDMLDTALIGELEVPVLNRAVKKNLKEDGKVIPRGAFTYMQIVYVNYDFLGYTLPLPYFEDMGNVRKYEYALSEKELYHEVDFLKINNRVINKSVLFNTIADGNVNAIRITTSVNLANDIIVEGKNWLNPPLVLPFDETEVKKGDEIKVSISYELGGGMGSIHYEVEHFKKNFRGYLHDH